jgi:hypothetical protein
LVALKNENTRGCTGWCLESHDLAVSKVVAGREKDLEFVGALFAEGLARVEVVRERLVETGVDVGVRESIDGRLRRLEAAAP